MAMPDDKIPSGKVIPPELVPDAGEVDFFKNLENPEICKPEEINPSKPGWEVIIYFDEQDPQKENSSAAKDWWGLEEWEALGLFKLRYSDKPVREAILTHSEDCLSQAFDQRQLELFGRYRLLAKAPLHARRDVEVANVAEQVEDVIDLTDNEHVEMLSDDDINKITNFDFVLLAISIPASQIDLPMILERLHAIAVDEEMEIKAEEVLQTVEVYFSKRDDVDYAKPMEGENAKFLEDLNYSLVD